MHFVTKLNKVKFHSSCFLLPFFILSCGVGKKEDKSKGRIKEFQNVTFGTSGEVAGQTAQNIPLTIKMVCNSINYNHVFQIGGKNKNNIDIPFNTECHLNVISFEANSRKYVRDEKYVSNQINTTGSKDSVKLNLEQKNVLYLHSTASAFLTIKEENKKITVYISEFTGAENAKLINDQNTKSEVNIEDIQLYGKVDLSKFHYNSGWLVKSETEANFWYIADTNHPLFKNNCKVHFNKTARTKLTSPYRINTIDTVFNESNTPCTDFIFSHDDIPNDRTFDSKDEYIANDYIEKEVFMVFKEAVDEKKNIFKYNLIKKENTESLLIILANYAINEFNNFDSNKDKAIYIETKYGKYLPYIENTYKKVENKQKEAELLSKISKLKNALDNFRITHNITKNTN